MSATALTVYRRALALIEDRKHWTRKAYARDANGREVRVYDEKAVRFCAVGALLRAEHELGAMGRWPLGLTGPLVHCLTPNFDTSVASANDTPVKDGGVGHKGIVEAFRCAIENLEKSP